jgi:hypothetical protein
VKCKTTIERLLETKKQQLQNYYKAIITMFLSHLIFILSTIGFLLFIMRSRQQSAFEVFLTFFSFLYFSSSGVFLYINYYSNSPLVLLDNYGVLNENITLLLPVFIVSLFNKKASVKKVVLYLLLAIIIGFLFSYVHYVIATEGKLIFFPSNKNLRINVFVQLIYDFLLFIFFLVGLKKINLKESNELFDGTYKKVFSLLFVIYYIQDMLFFVTLLNSDIIKGVLNGVYIFSLFSNLIISLLIIALAVYTNWLFYVNKFKENLVYKNLPNGSDRTFVFDIRQCDKKISSWNDFKQSLPNEYYDFIIEIDNLSFLSKTEKLYAALQPFNFSHKEISEFLNISLRTVSTNFYRLRVTLKENNRLKDYPYNNV